MRLTYSKYSLNKGVQKIKTKTAITLSSVGLSIAGIVSALAFALAPAAAVTTSTVYNNMPNPAPGNVFSEAFEAQTVSEFGGQVAFTSGTARSNPTVTVLMSSWGCQTGHWYSGDCSTGANATFSEPITLNIYNVNVDNSAGSVVATATQTFDVPYRPSADPTHCTGDQAGKWFNASDSTCYNGFATPISFSLTGATLPNKAIISVAYNTTHYGYSPIGETASCFNTGGGCGYDSLNVGLNSVNASPGVGTDPLPSDAYLNAHLVQTTSSNAGYCSPGAVDTFRLDTGCWTGFQPAFKVEASAATLPTSKDQCKDNGWKNYGTTFKNQGDCVSFVATGGKNQPSGH